MSTTDESLAQQFASNVWKHLRTTLFRRDVPKETSWDDIGSISQVLKEVTKLPGESVLFSPEREAGIFQGVFRSTDQSLLELYFDFIAILHPQKLLYYSYGESVLWDHLRIVAAPTEPMGVLPESFYEQNKSLSEPIDLSRIQLYETPESFGEKRQKSVSVPIGKAKHYYKGGDFVIFHTLSPFLKIWKDDMGLHQRLGEKGFRDFIQKMADAETARP